MSRLPYWKPIERTPFIEALRNKKNHFYARLLVGHSRWCIVFLREEE